MRTYETIIIIHPEMAGDAYKDVVEKYKGILGELGARIVAVEEWGTRKLAYIIQKQERGIYVLIAYEGKPEGIRELERRLRIDEKIIKFMTIQLDGSYEPSGFVRKTDESASAEKAERTSARATEADEADDDASADTEEAAADNE